MSVEFTGERVIPGLVDADLWNEHFSRYALAARFAGGLRVLDIGSGAGYGSAELARTAHEVTGIDVGEDAIAYARENYPRENLHFEHATATALPFGDGVFDLVVAFEVIEHLHDWPQMLHEARRVLTSGGQLLVSTPNKLYYSETRQQSGPNPYHTHEFEYGEYRDALRAVFPHVSIWAENHAAGIVFQPCENGGDAAVQIEAGETNPAEAHFFVALCSAAPLSDPGAFAYIPSAANALRERERHIRRLEEELAMKDEWLRRSQDEHHKLVGLHQETIEEIREANAWAQRAVDELEAERADFVVRQNAFLEIQKAYEDARLLREAELAECRAHFHEAERLVEERTLWAQSLDREIESLVARLNRIGVSKWHRLGRRLGLGPVV